MKKMSKAEALKIPEVVEEINRHLWIESEKAGKNIGFDKAADDWMRKYLNDWLKHFKPEVKKVAKAAAAKKKTAKKRSAKSYG